MLLTSHMLQTQGDISYEETDLLAHSTDASIFKVTPKAIIYPKNTEDIQSIVLQVKEKRLEGEEISLSVRAGGTCMSGGSLSNGYILNLTRHMNSVTVNVIQKTATVEMGAYFRDIESKAAEHGLMFAPYPSSRKICGIGGMIGNNASGEKSVRFGPTLENIQSLTVILSDGTTLITGRKKISEATSPLEISLIKIAKEKGNLFAQLKGNVPKVASGYQLDKVIVGDTYDLTPLFTGAQGTLGIITEAVLTLVPIPRTAHLVVIPIESLKDIPEILHKAKASNAESVETFDIHTYEKAHLVLPEDVAVTSFVFDEQTKGVILVQFSEDNDELTRNQAENYVTLLKEKNIVSFSIVEKKIINAFWNIRRNSFSLVRDNHDEGFRAVPCIEDIIVPIENFSTFIERLTAILEQKEIIYAYHGHIGDGSLRIIPLFDFREAGVATKIIDLTHDVFLLVKELKGNMSADHSDGIIRTPFIKDFYGEEMYECFLNIKNLFDPNNIMNPNKKVNGTKELIEKYLNK